MTKFVTYSQKSVPTIFSRTDVAKRYLKGKMSI